MYVHVREYGSDAVLNLFKMFYEQSRYYERGAPSTQGAYVAGLYCLLDATIVGGLHWDKETARVLNEEFHVSGKYVFDLDERAYTTAVKAGNRSACTSIERYFKRKAWRWPLNSCPPEGSGMDEGARVAVNFQVWFEDGWWAVTSMHDDRLTICSYAEVDEERKLVGRRTLTREEVAGLKAKAA